MVVKMWGLNSVNSGHHKGLLVVMGNMGSDRTVNLLILKDRQIWGSTKP
jgi:hypothetical protein